MSRCLTLAILAFACSVTPAAAADWPYWRGPTFDGQAQASGLPEDWDPADGEGSNVLWMREDIGGPCTPIAMNGRIYTIQRSMPSTEREGEKVAVCLDAATGKTLWENAYNVWLSDVPAERIGWSSVLGDPETGNVYALGAVLRGKVWPRDEEEPKEWTITARVESPNLASSLVLYRNAKVAELYLDNIEVTPNA